ncbi:MAG TPA: M28 family metallopeptidase [Terriglobales bacterium]|nr:M28 family metallopeptidase [Terriglobales bacterium]
MAVASAEEAQFLAVPNTASAEQNMKVLTAEPHMAGTPEDWKTAQYVAQKFRDAGLETTIVPYKVWLNYPAQVNVDIVYPTRIAMKGPTPEQVDGDRFQNDPRVLPAFSGYSPSGEVTADIVYVNYGRPEDFKLLKDRGIDVRGKIVLVRYGENFRGVKTYLAQEAGAAGVIMYSDPLDDGYTKGESYPKGPWRPDTGVQRGTVEFGFQHPGDPTTPGFAGTMDLPDSKRVKPEDNPDMPKIPTTPISAHDAQPMLANLGGPECPRDWQGALPFTYHMGPGPVRVHLNLKQDYGYRTIWNVIGKIRGSEYPDELVIAGNHRDAWVYGAVDPISGTIAMLEAVKGVGELLKSGWQPKRTIVFASWDAEEQGLVGSTEWVEQNEQTLGKAVAYFNTDTGAAGPNFRAAATPSLRMFLRDISKIVPSPKGGMLYDQWRSWGRMTGVGSAGGSDVSLGNLGSGSDYTSFVDHLGVPSSDIRTSGNYGVYHSVFDNYEWYRKFGDPGFVYSQMLARVFGLEVLRMADATVLPYDYEGYAQEILMYVQEAEKRAQDVFGEGAPNFTAALHAARRFMVAGHMIGLQPFAVSNVRELNSALLATERELLLPNGLPRRPWFKHSIFAPADLKGYTASVIPGVNEAIENGDLAITTEQIFELAKALNRAAGRLESYRPSVMNARK